MQKSASVCQICQIWQNCLLLEDYKFLLPLSVTDGDFTDAANILSLNFLKEKTILSSKYI